MVLPFRNPPTPEAVEAHRELITRCRGAACFAAIARHFGTSYPNMLERRIDGRTPYKKGDEKSWPGKYRKWLRDGKSPSSETCDFVRTKSGQSVDLKRLRDLFLWDLLQVSPPSLDALHEYMVSMPLQIRRKLSAGMDEDGTGRFARHELERDTVLSLRNLGSLDAFQALLCLAREGEIINDDRRHYLPALCAYDLVPRVLHSHPELRAVWERLYDCLEFVYWNRAYLGNMTFRPSKEKVAECLGQLDANPSAAIEQLAGRRQPRVVPEPFHKFGFTSDADGSGT